MSIVLPTLVCLAIYFVGYRFYSKFLASKIFALDKGRTTPAHALTDGVDYVPTRRSIVFGHHYASITGLAPMLGPAVAVIWGWVPAMIWVVLGAVFVGCVHDFSALVVSLRARGMSIGKVAQGIMGPRAKTLFHAIIFFGVSLAMGVFVLAIARLFSIRIDANTPGYPSAVTPSAGLMVVALAMGFLLYKKGLKLGPLAAGAFVLSLLLVWLGHAFPTFGVAAESWPEAGGWKVVLLVYAFIASVLPVWVLLQARDFVNSMLLYLGVGAAYIGAFVLAPTFQAPAYRPEVSGSPNIVPFVFIIIACGAASGFHGLVSSGTTAKQLDNETDARPVGYGGMIAESLLGLLAVLATTAGFSSTGAWEARYHDWTSVQGLAGNISAFIDGAARFIASLGVPHNVAASFIAVVVVSFALTTLDSATRLLRFNIEEMSETMGLSVMKNRYLSSVAAVGCIAFFAFYKSAAITLWALFGITNQLLAGLTLLAVTLYLQQRGRPVWFTGIPAVLMLGSTLTALGQQLIAFVERDQILLLVVGAILFGLACWVVVEGILVLRSGRRVEGLDIDIDNREPTGEVSAPAR